MALTTNVMANVIIILSAIALLAGVIAGFVILSIDADGSAKATQLLSNVALGTGLGAECSFGRGREARTLDTARRCRRRGGG